MTSIPFISNRLPDFHGRSSNLLRRYIFLYLVLLLWCDASSARAKLPSLISTLREASLHSLCLLLRNCILLFTSEHVSSNCNAVCIMREVRTRRKFSNQNIEGKIHQASSYQLYWRTFPVKCPRILRRWLLRSDAHVKLCCRHQARKS